MCSQVVLCSIFLYSIMHRTRPSAALLYLCGALVVQVLSLPVGVSFPKALVRVLVVELQLPRLGASANIF